MKVSDFVDTTPALPATGLKIFSRNRARRLPAFVGPLGQDARLQPSFASNRVNMIVTSNNSATLGYFAVPAVTAYTANTAVAIAATSFYGSLVRTRFPGGSTVAATQAGFRHSNLWHLSSTPNKGGFHWVLRAAAGAGQSGGGRAAVGLFVNTAALSNAEPSSLASWVGFGYDSTHTNWRFMTNDASGTATSVDLGTNFPARDYGTYFYEFALFATSGGGNRVNWSVTRLNDGLVASGAATTDLPALDTLLGTQAVLMSTAAATIGLDVQSLYVETDN